MEADNKRNYEIIPRLSSYTDLFKNKREESFPKRGSLIEIVSSRENSLSSFLQHDVITFHNNIKQEKQHYFCCFKSNKISVL